VCGRDESTSLVLGELRAASVGPFAVAYSSDEARWRIIGGVLKINLPLPGSLRRPPVELNPATSETRDKSATKIPADRRDTLIESATFRAATCPDLWLFASPRYSAAVIRNFCPESRGLYFLSGGPHPSASLTPYLPGMNSRLILSAGTSIFRRLRLFNSHSNFLTFSIRSRNSSRQPSGNASTSTARRIVSTSSRSLT
jgi:hypothetical protein